MKEKGEGAMQEFLFNDGWKYRRLGEGAWTPVTLPHDAMIGEERSDGAAGGTNTGWFAGYDYEYEKTFFVPAEYRDRLVTLEFEGVYRGAEVYLNGEKAACRPYGYTNFYVEADAFLRYGRENTVRVIARNREQPSSRWYSGAGIYRPVRLYVAARAHILRNGIRIRTVGLSPATVEVRVAVSCAGALHLAVSRRGKRVAEAAGRCGAAGELAFSFVIPDAELWSPDHPALYELEARFGGECPGEDVARERLGEDAARERFGEDVAGEEDVARVRFGIRTISCDAARGFCLNGERLVLRGACIHHDNGILGARCYAEAERRKVRLLKAAGYNALRSAHNPCSKALLDACDELGMLMVDEYADMWYIHKTAHDYADHLPAWYEEDLRDMVEKDRNHPCVALYSLGNEVAETGQARGIGLCKAMYDVCKRLDPDRPVTVGVNLFFNWLYALGFGVYSDKKAQKAPQKKVGSEFFNALAGRMGAGFMKFMATLPPCDAKTRGCYAVIDAAGYNYGIRRYKKDIKKHPARVILGSETFCADAYAFWEFAKAHPALIGDFVWAGMDYLGEVGIGSWEYKEYAPSFAHGAGWLAAGSGRLDLIGTPQGEALYTRVAFELEDKPQIAVVPVSHTDERHSPSAWKFSNAIPSWSWNGLDGRPARVEVYSRAPVVELYVNGRRVGRKKFRKNCRFDFRVTYEGGEIVAIARDTGGKELARSRLQTAGEETVLSVLPEQPRAKPGEVCFVRLAYTDAAGNKKPLARGRIAVEAEGGELLALGHACPYNPDGFLRADTDTYYGEALAAVRAGAGGRVVVRARSPFGSACAEIPISDRPE